MSNEYNSRNTIDNEQKKFKADPLGNVAVNVSGEYLRNISASQGSSFFASTNTPLANGASFDSGIQDLGTDLGYLYTEIASDQNGTLQGIWYDDANGTNVIRTFSLPYTIDLELSYTGTKRLSRYLRYIFTNNSGFDQVRFHLRGVISSSPTAGQLLRVDQFIPPNVLAQLTRSVLVGEDSTGTYQNVRVNKFGALPVSNFLYEVARGLYDGVENFSKFGRNSEINTAAAEDVWNGGLLYTGFNPTANENLRTLSASANDVGTLVASGTATGGTSTTIVDSGATFITAGVAVGDVIINDTVGFHGFVEEVVSQTTLRVRLWVDGDLTETLIPEAGDLYRIARPASTGAGVVKWSRVLNSDYIRQPSVYVIMNGLTPVITTGNFFRLSKGEVINAGSLGTSAGAITCSQATTTANIFAVMPINTNSTVIAADSVPAGKLRVIYSARCSIARASGTAGSANVAFFVRNFRGVFKALIDEEVTTSIPFFNSDLALVVPQKSDMKWRVLSVSDNSTICTANFKFFDFDV